MKPELSEGMAEYTHAHAIRCEYPLVLTVAQQKAIVERLPARPAREDMVSLALSHGLQFADLTELELYWRYQIKVSEAIAVQHAKDYRKAPSKALGHVQGLFFKQTLMRCALIEDPKFDLPQKRKLELTREMLTAWRAKLPSKLWELQKEGIRDGLAINKSVFGTNRINTAIAKMLEADEVSPEI
jgi:hypothetical protein